MPWLGAISPTYPIKASPSKVVYCLPHPEFVRNIHWIICLLIYAQLCITDGKNPVILSRGSKRMNP